MWELMFAVKVTNVVMLVLLIDHTAVTDTD
jgi:hypothetical protein